MDITEANIDFVPLTNQNLENTLLSIDQNDTLDFRLRILYSHLDKNYSRITTRCDTFLARSELANSILIMKVHLIDGPWHTSCKGIVDIIVGEIDRGNKI